MEEEKRKVGKEEKKVSQQDREESVGMGEGDERRTDGEEERVGWKERTRRRKKSIERGMKRKGRKRQNYSLVYVRQEFRGTDTGNLQSQRHQYTLRGYVTEDPGTWQGRAGVTFPVLSTLRPHQSDPTLSKLRCSSALLRLYSIGLPGRFLEACSVLQARQPLARRLLGFGSHKNKTIPGVT